MIYFASDIHLGAGDVRTAREVERRFVALRPFDGGQRVGQLGVHGVPREVDAGIVPQVPVQPRGERDVVVAPDDDAVAALVEFEEVVGRFDFLEDEFARGAGVDAVGQSFDGSGGGAGCRPAQQCGHTDVFHVDRRCGVRVAGGSLCPRRQGRGSLRPESQRPFPSRFAGRKRPPWRDGVSGW